MGCLLLAGAQRLTDHLKDALQDLTAVRLQENDLLKRRVDLCHKELEDQVAELERSFQLKVRSSCKQIQDTSTQMHCYTVAHC